MSQAAAKMKAVSRISLFGARTPADAKIELTVGSVSLTSKLAQRYDGKKVIVELDMPGQEDELKRSAAVVLKLGEAKVNWLCKYEIGSSGSDNPVREALIAALLTDEDEDSEVLINVYGVNEHPPLRRRRIRLRPKRRSSARPSFASRRSSTTSKRCTGSRCPCGMPRAARWAS